MYQPKADIFSALSQLGYYCAQSSQAIFSDGQIPAITFRIDDNSTNLDIDNQITSQNIIAVIDIFTNDSLTASDILSQVESTMRAIGYRLEYSADIPGPTGALYHINARFLRIYAASN